MPQCPKMHCIAFNYQLNACAALDFPPLWAPNRIGFDYLLVCCVIKSFHALRICMAEATHNRCFFLSDFKPFTAAQYRHGLIVCAFTSEIVVLNCLETFSTSIKCINRE